MDSKEGPFTERREKDKIVIKGNYTNGEKHGVWDFYDINTD